MEILDLFPTPIGWFELGRDITAEEMTFISSQETKPNVGNASSINSYILESSELINLRKFFEVSLDEYFQKIYCPVANTNLRITQSWANYTPPGGYHHKHAHPNSIISGIFYVKTNPETDRIYFCNDEHKQLKVQPRISNIYNTETWWFSSVAGYLILFPSELPHMVHNTSVDSNIRISISFNTFPIGTFGNKNELTEVLF